MGQPIGQRFRLIKSWQSSLEGWAGLIGQLLGLC